MLILSSHNTNSSFVICTYSRYLQLRGVLYRTEEAGGGGGGETVNVLVTYKIYIIVTGYLIRDASYIVDFFDTFLPPHTHHMIVHLFVCLCIYRMREFVRLTYFIGM